MDRDEAFQRVVVGELAEIRKAARLMAGAALIGVAVLVLGVIGAVLSG